jgi:autotransporter-associated beta strand protein
VQNFDVEDVTGDTNADLIVNMTLDNGGSNGGTGGVNKLGLGTMSITRQASYTGGTTVNDGTLSLDANGDYWGLLRGTITVKDGATLRLNANDVTGYGTGSDRVSTINLEAGGTMHISTTQNQTLGRCVVNMTGARITGIAGSNLDFFDYDNLDSANGGSALNTFASDTASTISGTRVDLRQSSVTFNVENGGAAYDLDISSRVYGNAMVKDGAGTMRLTGPADYGGTTTINAGTLVLHDSAGWTTYQGGQININNGSTLEITGSRYDFGTKTFNFGSTGGGSILTGGGLNWVAQGNWTVTTNGGAKNTIGGAEGINLNNGNGIVFNTARGTDSTSDLDVLNGIGNTPGGLTKNGDGILTLNGTNGYTGSTTVNAGMLVVNGSTAASSAVTVASGATLAGTGTVAGAVTVTGKIAPGVTGIESLNTGAVTWKGADSAGVNTDWSFQLGAGNASDLLDIAGNFTKDTSAGSVFRFDFLGSNFNGIFDLVKWTGTTDFSNTDFSYTNLGGGKTGTFTINGSTLQFTAVPEPTSAAAGVLLGAGLLRRRRKA